MQFYTLLAIATFCGVSVANFNVHLYKEPSCIGPIKASTGHTCTGIAAGVCCARRSGDPKKGTPAPWAKFRSANFDEGGSKKTTDRIKLYDSTGGEACGLDFANSNKCASGSKEGTGAKVVIEVPTGGGSGRSHKLKRFIKFLTREAKGVVVEPDQYFYENGTMKWTLDIKSVKGQHYNKLASEEEQIKYIEANGVMAPML